MTYTRIITFLVCFGIYRPVGICSNLATLNNEAAQLYQLGKYQQAERLWLRAMNTTQEGISRATIASNLGSLYRRIGRLEEAEYYFRHCFALRRKALGDSHTDTAIALNNVATIEITSGLYQNAEQHLRTALSASRLQPADRVSIETNLGNLLRMDGRITEANSHLQSAFALADNSAPVHFALGRLAEDRADFEQARQHYVVALSLDRNPTAQTHLARLLLKAGDFVEARQLLQNALARRPSTEETIAILQTTAAADLAQSRLPHAVYSLKQAVELQQRMLGSGHPSLAPILLQYASALRKMGDTKRAKGMDEWASRISQSGLESIQSDFHHI